MAALAMTPVDAIGMPLPILPFDEHERDASLRSTDWHHHFHPRRSPLLTDDGGKAIRNVRLQLTDWKEHHILYHGYYNGPELPTTAEEKFGLTVLAIAGYVPAEALDVSRRKPRVVKLSDDQRDRLWNSGELRVAGPDAVRKFLVQHTLGQSLESVDENIVDEFLNSTSRNRRIALGSELLKYAVDLAVEPLDPFYRSAWKKGYINRLSAYRPQRLVRTKLKIKSHGDQMIEQLYDKLAA